MPEIITIQEGTCTPIPPLISVDRPIIKTDEDTVLGFVYDLPGRQPATVEFYDATSKGVQGQAIENFCENMTGPLVVDSTNDSSNPKFCNPTSDGDFAYTVAATGYQTLDPVLIIEEAEAPSVSLLTLFLAVGGAGIGFGFAGFRFGLKAALKRLSQPSS